MELKLLDRKEKIIISALDILGEYGYKGLTISSIAKSQKISEPALYRHFKSKKEIINAIIDKAGGYDEMIQNTLKQGEYKLFEGIEFYLYNYASIYENYPQLASIYFSYDLFKYEKDTLDKIKKILRKRKEFLTEFIISKEIPSDKAEFLQKIIHDKIFAAIYGWEIGLIETSLKDEFEIFIKNLEEM